MWQIALFPAQTLPFLDLLSEVGLNLHVSDWTCGVPDPEGHLSNLDIK
jgi:hypothetical protein